MLPARFSAATLYPNKTRNDAYCGAKPGMTTMPEKGQRTGRIAGRKQSQRISHEEMDELLRGTGLKLRIGKVGCPLNHALNHLVFNMRDNGRFHCAEVGCVVVLRWWQRNRAECHVSLAETKRIVYSLWDTFNLPKASRGMLGVAKRARLAELPESLQGESASVQLAYKIMRDLAGAEEGVAVKMTGFTMGLALEKSQSTADRALRRLMAMGMLTRTVTGKPADDWTKPGTGTPSEYLWHATAQAPVDAGRVPYAGAPGSLPREPGDADGFRAASPPSRNGRSTTSDAPSLPPPPATPASLRRPPGSSAAPPLSRQPSPSPAPEPAPCSGQAPRPPRRQGPPGLPRGLLRSSPTPEEPRRAQPPAAP